MTAPARGVVGVDIGGTSIRAVSLADGSQVPGSQRRRPRPAGADAIVDAVRELVDEVAPAELIGVGVGCAGLVDADGVVRTSPNIDAFVDYPLRDRLAERLAVPVTLDNDANAAAVAELRSGALVGARSALFVAFGTGIGGAVVVDGRLVRGEHGFAGEFGHMRVAPDGPWCVCGRRGCWEQMASGTALERLARGVVADGRGESILRAAGGDPAAIRSEAVADLVHDGDTVACELLEEVVTWAAVGVDALVLALDPAVVVVGGGLSEIGAPFLGALDRALVGAAVERDHRPPPAVVPAAHGDAAGALGAAMLARSPS